MINITLSSMQLKGEKGAVYLYNKQLGEWCILTCIISIKEKSANAYLIGDFPKCC